MDVQNAYDQWADQYDTNRNRTRDLEALALREILEPFQFESTLEIGCGTGKNTVWLKDRSARLLSVDLSGEMLARAREKVQDPHVQFMQANILQPWDFTKENNHDLAVFSLVLEHIEQLSPIFSKLSTVLKPGGKLYIGELHPFKQYGGSKARFETAEGTTVVNCFNHHISDFTTAARDHGFRLIELKEYFDGDNEQEIPRILCLLFEKTENVDHMDS